MGHLNDGTLRRMVDEPLTVSDSDREHIAACSRCAERHAALAREAQEVEALLAAPAAQIDASAALARFHRRLATDPSAVGEAPRQGRRVASLLPGRSAPQGFRRRLAAPLSGLAAAAALVGALTLTPAGSLAEQFITIFQPAQISVVPITTSELQALPDLQKFGTVHAPAQAQPQSEPDLAAAEAATSMHVLTPASVPAGVPTAVSYQVMPSQTGSFTFSAARAAQTAASDGTTLPPMPAKVDGSTIQITTGDAALAIYGGNPGSGNIPSLVVGQMKAPTVASTGASLQDLEDYLLQLPGVSPQLAAEIKSIGDPSSTLPLPIPVDRAGEHSVQVQGVQGVAVGDSTGIGSVVIWEKDGIIYGVGGTLSESQVLDVASSLH